MKIRDLIVEVGTAGSVVDPAKSTQSNQNTGPDVNKLSSMVTNLQKQVQDLQKSALQTSAQIKSPGAPTPQAQQPAPSTIKPVGSTAPGQNVQQAGNQTPGQTPNQVAGTPSLAPAAKVTPNNQVVPGVNQPTQITNMKIKQQLAQNQGKGT